MTARRLRRRLIATAIGVVMALVGAEILLRVTGLGVIAPRESDYKFVASPDGTDTWSFDPRLVAHHAWDGDPYGTLPPGARIEYRDINAAGLRGPLPRGGERTVLFVGDSFTFGEGVPWDASFVARLDAAWESTADDPDGRLRAVAAGVPGYGTREQLLRLPDWIKRFRPVAVVLVFVPNDAIPLETYLDEPGDLLRMPSVDTGMPRVLALALRVRNRERLSGSIEDWYLSHYTGERSASWDRAQTQLKALRDRSVSAGARFGVVYFPLLHDLGTSPLRAIRDEVGLAVEALPAPWIDLTPHLAAVQPERDLWLHPTDRHPNRVAHALVAEHLLPFVTSLVDE